MDFLRESIRSVLDQTFKDFELLIIDDRSIDNTRDVVASFQDERIKYILNNRSRGGAGARNAGIFMAKGEWVAFLDDDDIWLPQKFEILYKKIEMVDHTVGLIYTGHAVYDFEKKEEISQHVPFKEGWIQKDLLYDNYVGTFSAVAIRKTVLEKVGGLDERFKAMQDMELYVRVAGISKIEFIKETLSYIRRSHTDRISVNTQKKLESCLLFYEKNTDLIIRNPQIRHRISSLIFIYALRQKRWAILFKSFPWTLAGLLFDIRNFLQITWGSLLIFCKSND